MLKKMIIPAILGAYPAYELSASKVSTDDLLNDIVSICKENDVGQKKGRAIKPSQKVYGDAVVPYADALAYLSIRKVPAVRMLTFNLRAKENAFTIQQESCRFNVSASFLPIAVVEGDTYDFLNLKAGSVERKALITGMGDEENAAQDYDSWDSLKDWLESHAKVG